MNLPLNVVLVGFMGAGKTSTGKELARMLGFDFLDTDQLIEEKAGMKISEIFEKKGEAFFRAQEMDVVERLKTKEKCVMATGGGVWLNEANRKELMRIGFCVWLVVSAEKVMERIGSNLIQRPLLSGPGNPKVAAEKLLSERTSHYSLAHAKVETDKKTPKEVASEILKLLNEGRAIDLS
jgi:shikimate kinase